MFARAVLTLILLLGGSAESRIHADEAVPEARTYAIPDELRLTIPEEADAPFLVVGKPWKYLEGKVTDWAKEKAGVVLVNVRVHNPVNTVIIASPEVHAKLSEQLRAIPKDINDTIILVRVHVLVAEDILAANRLLEMTSMKEVFADGGIAIRSSITTRTKLAGISKLENVVEFIYPTEYESPEGPDEPSAATAFEMRPIGTTVGINGYWDDGLAKIQYGLEHVAFMGFLDFGNEKRESVLQPVFQSWNSMAETHLDGSLVIVGGGSVPRPMVSSVDQGTPDAPAHVGPSVGHLYFAIDAKALPHR